MQVCFQKNMDFNEFTALIKRKKATIFNLTFLLVVLVMLVSLLGGIKYSAKSKLLVFQDNAGLSDPYTVSRSNEYLSTLLSQVVYSSSFFNMVTTNPQYRVDTSFFPGSYADRLKLWRKTVATKVVDSSGIIEVNVYHVVPDQARIITLAINDVLINQNANYHGGQGVKVSVLDQPLVSDYPNKPNLVFNFFFSFFIGIFLSLIFIYLYPERAYDLRFFPKKKKKEVIYSNKRSVPIQVVTDFRPSQAPAETPQISNQEMPENSNHKLSGDISGILD